MIYKIQCEACLGYSCGGMYHGDTGTLSVDLTDTEAQQLRDNIASDTDDALGDIEDKFPAIYDKIMDEVYTYVYFVVANDARESGLWQDCIQSGRGIDDFIQEDIDCGAIDDEDEEGHRLSDHDLYRLWSTHEDEYIHGLPYHEAYEYIIQRYECQPDNIDCVDYSIELPEELLHIEEE